jgi:hypothetical protein
LKGTAVVLDNQQTKLLINKKGEILESKTKVDELSRDESEIQTFWDEERKGAGLRTRAGRIILSPTYEAVGVFQESRSIVKEKGKWGVVDKTGRFIVPPTYEEMAHFIEGLASFKLDGKYGFVDRSGKVVIAPQFDVAGSFSHGLAAVIVAGKVGYIDKKGKFAIAPIFNETSGGRWSDFESTN